jgi:hypothetical protein
VHVEQGWNDLQETHSKCREYSHSFRDAHLEREDRGKWHEKGEAIQHNVRNGKRIAFLIDITAVRSLRMSEAVGKWMAEGKEGSPECDEKDNIDPDHAPRRICHKSVGTLSSKHCHGEMRH